MQRRGRPITRFHQAMNNAFGRIAARGYVSMLVQVSMQDVAQVGRRHLPAVPFVCVFPHCERLSESMAVAPSLTNTRQSQPSFADPRPYLAWKPLPQPFNLRLQLRKLGRRSRPACESSKCNAHNVKHAVYVCWEVTGETLPNAQTFIPPVKMCLNASAMLWKNRMVQYPGVSRHPVAIFLVGEV